ncbi:hypothetical protein Sru01_09570 [Sphaerisporangium rufum]|uniref:Uncharacterized protein n=1 Tax=Sphaerisporangium rufum TaxID=1381558 RepID=A0A919V359_9ACTN|nr:hypothetical protein Sru01_09570 [Sphaerisporangium rufum]
MIHAIDRRTADTGLPDDPAERLQVPDRRTADTGLPDDPAERPAAPGGGAGRGGRISGWRGG